MSLKLQNHMELQKVLDQLLWEELKEADGCTTQETISLRAAEKVLKMLRINFATVQNLTHCIRIHRHWSLYIRDLWNNKLKTSVSADDNNAFERFMAKDYHKPVDLYRFAAVLMKRAKGHAPFIFAMDGFLGSDVKKYVKNLQYYSSPAKTAEGPQEIHTSAVRSMYSCFHNVAVESVHRAVTKVVCREENEEEEEEEDDEENKLRHHYRHLVGDRILEIRQWLTTILKQQEQQTKKRLRIRISKKRKLEDEEEEEEDDDDEDDGDEST